MGLIKKEVQVVKVIEVTIDEEKFTPEFFEEFNASMHDLGDDVDEHIKFLATLHVRGVADNDSFIEGYGPAKDMGIRFEEIGDEETDIIS
jgi:hypothetical protein